MTFANTVSDHLMIKLQVAINEAAHVHSALQDVIEGLPLSLTKACNMFSWDGTDCTLGRHDYTGSSTGVPAGNSIVYVEPGTWHMCVHAFNRISRTLRQKMEFQGYSPKKRASIKLSSPLPPLGFQGGKSVER